MPSKNIEKSNSKRTTATNAVVEPVSAANVGEATEKAVADLKNGVVITFYRDEEELAIEPQDTRGHLAILIRKENHEDQYISFYPTSEVLTANQNDSLGTRIKKSVKKRAVHVVHFPSLDTKQGEYRTLENEKPWQNKHQIIIEHDPRSRFNLDLDAMYNYSQGLKYGHAGIEQNDHYNFYCEDGGSNCASAVVSVLKQGGLENYLQIQGIKVLFLKTSIPAPADVFLQCKKLQTLLHMKSLEWFFVEQESSSKKLSALFLSKVSLVKLISEDFSDYELLQQILSKANFATLSEVITNALSKDSNGGQDINQEINFEFLRNLTKLKEISEKEAGNISLEKLYRVYSQRKQTNASAKSRRGDKASLPTSIMVFLSFLAEMADKAAADETKLIETKELANKFISRMLPKLIEGESANEQLAAALKQLQEALTDHKSFVLNAIKEDYINALYGKARNILQNSKYKNVLASLQDSQATSDLLRDDFDILLCALGLQGGHEEKELAKSCLRKHTDQPKNGNKLFEQVKEIFTLVAYVVENKIDCDQSSKADAWDQQAVFRAKNAVKELARLRHAVCIKIKFLPHSKEEAQALSSQLDLYDAAIQCSRQFLGQLYQFHYFDKGACYEFNGKPGLLETWCSLFADGRSKVSSNNIAEFNKEVLLYGDFKNTGKVPGVEVVNGEKIIPNKSNATVAKPSAWKFWRWQERERLLEIEARIKIYNILHSHNTSSQRPHEKLAEIRRVIKENRPAWFKFWHRKRYEKLAQMAESVCVMQAFIEGVIDEKSFISELQEAVKKPYFSAIKGNLKTFIGQFEAKAKFAESSQKDPPSASQEEEKMKEYYRDLTDLCEKGMGRGFHYSKNLAATSRFFKSPNQEIQSETPPEVKKVMQDGEEALDKFCWHL